MLALSVAGWFFFIFGLIIGSFLNCLLYRLEKSEDFIAGSSYCPKCKHPLSWKDLIPVVSWIFLKGKCRYCKQKISIEYPLIEFATGILFVLTSLFVFANYPQFQLFHLSFYLVVVTSLLVVFIFDLRHYLVSEAVLLYTGIFVVVWRIIAFILEIHTLNNLLFYLLAAILSALFFWILYLLTNKKGMGFGDIEIVFLLGLIVGFPDIFFVIFIASLLGSIIGLLAITFFKKTMKTALPFGPFLVIATFAMLFYSDIILELYQQFLSFFVGNLV